MCDQVREGILVRDGRGWVKPKAKSAMGSEDLVMEAVLDTGSGAPIAVSSELVKEIDAVCIGEAKVVLANGDMKECRIHIGDIHWLGDWRSEAIVEVDSCAEPILGMPLLRRTRVVFENGTGYVESI